eukprot:TRINITY_DN6922_c0_g1_i2.p1 TRINITY_DN6922_c0_g1~~TRINITY_DN6922_c0_g1_i2.p1  ORF type:complete len:190 (+),score=12.70 TRINITY_DN6922_c0_g1_i2:31-600(+)
MSYHRLKKILSSAHKMYGRNLLVANTASSGGLLLLGDVLEQKREGAKAIDKHRSGRMFAVGISQGPPHHYFYEWLDKLYKGRTRQAIVKKILLDQILAAPFFAITFIYVASLLEGKTFAECWQEFKEKFPAIYLFDWLIWPPSQYINFSFVPSQYRVLYINFVTVLWDIFLSYIKHRESETTVMDIKPE